MNFSLFNNPLNVLDNPTEDYRERIVAQIVQRPTLLRTYVNPNGQTVRVFGPGTAQGAYFGKVRESRRNTRVGAE